MKNAWGTRTGLCLLNRSIDIEQCFKTHQTHHTRLVDWNEPRRLLASRMIPSSYPGKWKYDSYFNEFRSRYARNRLQIEPRACNTLWKENGGLLLTCLALIASSHIPMNYKRWCWRDQTFSMFSFAHNAMHCSPLGSAWKFAWNKIKSLFLSRTLEIIRIISSSFSPSNVSNYQLFFRFPEWIQFQYNITTLLLPPSELYNSFPLKGISFQRLSVFQNESQFHFPTPHR